MHNRRTLFKSTVRDGCIGLACVGFIYSCASVGRPDGGPYDETPPKFVGATPALKSTNNNRQRISIRFDEYVQLQNAMEKVVVSPPQLKQPEIKANGKSISVNLLDTLKSNTTYTIDFSDAIVDNNESNPLGNFSFSFSTGAVIDTMEVSGVVLDASNLEPIKGILVGLHRNLSDTAFTKLPFDRVSRTDSRGHFTIRGIAPGEYHIFALQDADQNFRFSQLSENVAFRDSLVIPTFEQRMRNDTVWKDTITVDTVRAVEYTHFLPDNIFLRAFREKSTAQYLKRAERTKDRLLTITFANEADTLPTLKGLNFDEKDAFIIEHSLKRDSILYWIRDSVLYKQDTLSLQLSYMYTDTLDQLVPKTDTLNLSMRPVRKSKDSEKEKDNARERRRKEESDTVKLPQTQFLPVNIDAASPMNVYGQIVLTFDEPIANYNKDAMHIRQKVDSTWKELTYTLQHDTVNIKRFVLFPPEWLWEKEYEFALDSIAFVGIYGLHTDKQQKNIKVRAEADYGSIVFSVTGADSVAFVELLNEQDKPVRRQPVVNGVASFYYLDVGKYGARLVNDRNKNGVWDTGVYSEHIQPEEVFYYPQVLDVRSLYHLDQEWNIHGQPLDRQKPLTLKKQKPDVPKQKDRNKTRNSNKQNNQRNNSSGNAPF